MRLRRLLSTYWWAAGFEHTMPAPLCHMVSVLIGQAQGPTDQMLISHSQRWMLHLCHPPWVACSSPQKPSPGNTQPQTHPVNPQSQCTTPSRIPAQPHPPHWLVTEQWRGIMVQVGDEQTWAPHLWGRAPVLPRDSSLLSDGAVFGKKNYPEMSTLTRSGIWPAYPRILRPEKKK